jgi:hypothetical protein
LLDGFQLRIVARGKRHLGHNGLLEKMLRNLNIMAFLQVNNDVGPVAILVAIMGELPGIKSQ